MGVIKVEHIFCQGENEEYKDHSHMIWNRIKELCKDQSYILFLNTNIYMYINIYIQVDVCMHV